MTSPRYDVLCIGNAIVDVIADTDDAFLRKQDLHKGSMRLIDEAEADMWELSPAGMKLPRA